jgi:protein-L-isoaspartate(D-aspartate) O-methyltransferase
MTRRVLLSFLCGAPFAATADPYAAERDRMVRDQIQARGIRDVRVIKAMLETPRHLFMPQSSASLAYRDQPAPIGHGATISQPYIVARMTELLEVKPEHQVLEIGTGSGFQAAILAQLAKRVCSIELEPELAASADERLRRMGYSNVSVREGDGYQGWPEPVEFDRIILTAAPPKIPAALVRQLAAGGRMVAPVGEGWDQRLVILDKARNGAVRTRTADAVLFVPMRPK